MCRVNRTAILRWAAARVLVHSERRLLPPQPRGGIGGVFRDPPEKLVERACRAVAVVLPFLALVVAAAFFFRELLGLDTPARYIASDFASYFYPVFRYVAEEIAAGRLPHWTPFVGAGYPLLADIEASVFYPPARLFTLVVGPPSYFALELYAIAHYVVAGAGMLVLLNQVGLPAIPAGVGALTFMFSGFFWAHVAHLSILQSSAWLPWLLAAHARALLTRSPGWAVTAGAVLALVALGGHPQAALYVAAALALFTLTAMETGWCGPSVRDRLRAVATTAAVLLLGLALAAPQLVPTLTLAPFTTRWSPSAEFIGSDALPVHQLLTFLVPLAYVGTERFRSMDEVYAYVGIGALVLAAAGVVLRRDTWSRFLGLATVVGLALALAPLLPGFPEIAEHLPVVGLFRASARATLLTDFGAAGLAALGLDAWRRALRRPEGLRRVRGLLWGWRGFVVLALGGEALLLARRVPAWAGPLAADFPTSYAFFVAILLAHVVVLEAWRAGWLPPRLGELFTLALIVINLTQPHRTVGWSPVSPETTWRPSAVVQELQSSPGRQRVWTDGGLHQGGRLFEANAGLLDRLEVVGHYTSLDMVRYTEFARALGGPHEQPLFADLLNVRYLVTAAAPHHRGRYSPPRLEPGEERQYDLTGLLEGAIGSVNLALEVDPRIGLIRSVTLAEAATSLHFCVDCPEGGTPLRIRLRPRGWVTAHATLAARRPIQEIRLINRSPGAVTVRTLRLDEVDLYALGGRYLWRGRNLWENSYALPRAYLVEDIVVQPDAGRVIPTLLGLDARETAVTELAPTCQASLAPSETSPPGVEVIEYQPTVVRLRTAHGRPGFLVLADARYKEWRARVDGRPKPIYTTNLLLRGVCVPAGRHEVEFGYQPTAFRRGLALALLGGLGAMAAVGTGRWRRRSARS